MSGIVGIVNLDCAPVDPALLQRMTGFMSFRGPDAQETWIDGHVGFGHTMLRTTFEAETEKQPLTLDGKTWLTADARIDGRSDLIAAIERKLQRTLSSPSRPNGDGPHAGTPNDADLILHAYEAWGEDCVKHLIGDFSFAIWDAVERQLFCARDHFGVKQFYYAHVGSALVFSNTLNCVRLHPAVSDELNEIVIGDYLLFGQNQDLRSTTFSAIQRLPQASRLTASGTKTTIDRFWNVPTNGEVRFANATDYVERFQELFSTAVADRLRTNKVSVSMSGGLDSTSVAAVARDLLRERSDGELRGYAVVYDRLIPDDERHFSSVAASALQMPITHIPADDYQIFEERTPHELQRPEPFLVVPTSAQFKELLRSMAAHGRVALSGWDGDALMAEPPNAHFAVLARNRKIKELLSDMGWFVWSRRQLPPVGFRRRLKRVLGTFSKTGQYPEWINESFARRTHLAERWKASTAEPVTSHATRPYAFRMLNSAGWAPLFESYDAGFNRVPLEMRHPLIDVRLVEYLLGVPAFPWCLHKEILRVSMAGKLPESVLHRPKTPLVREPALCLLKESGVRFLDGFEPVPDLLKFVDLTACFQFVGEQDAGRVWTNLRPFALNHWLRHSFAIDLTSERNMKLNSPEANKEASGKRRYNTPQVVTYGNIREITKNLGPKGNTDGGGGAAAGPKTGV